MSILPRVLWGLAFLGLLSLTTFLNSALWAFLLLPLILLSALSFFFPASMDEEVFDSLSNISIAMAIGSSLILAGCTIYFLWMSDLFWGFSVEGLAEDLVEKYRIAETPYYDRFAFDVESLRQEWSAAAIAKDGWLNKLYAVLGGLLVGVVLFAGWSSNGKAGPFFQAAVAVLAVIGVAYFSPPDRREYLDAGNKEEFKNFLTADNSPLEKADCNGSWGFVEYPPEIVDSKSIAFDPEKAKYLLEEDRDVRWGGTESLDFDYQNLEHSCDGKRTNRLTASALPGNDPQRGVDYSKACDLAINRYAQCLSVVKYHRNRDRGKYRPLSFDEVKTFARE